MPNPIVHWEIAAKDGKKLQSFYTDLFGWKINANNPMNYGLVKPGGKRGIGGGIFQGEQGDKRITIYAEVGDTDAFLKKAESLGGKTVMPTTAVPNMVTFAIFADPEGNLFGLVKRQALRRPRRAATLKKKPASRRR
jgi:predicted enzyme related to lactoylglutathione lyase